MTKKYQPNFNDPRISSRARQALTFVKTYISTTKPNWLSTRHIDQHLGMSGRPLGRYLRGLLLICVDDSYSKDAGKCKTYRANKEGIDYLESVVINNRTNNNIVSRFSEKFAEQLDSGEFEYNDTSSRLYHPLQNVRRETKQSVLADSGYHHTYDINCCAPTLIYQYSQLVGNEEYLFFITDYLKNKSSIRQRIALQAEISELQVKRIINGLFQGAHISNHSDTAVYKELEGDRARIEFLKQDQFLIGLRADIKICWDYIKPTLPRRTRRDRRGVIRTIPLSGRTKTALYRDLERQVLNAIRDYLEQTSNPAFLEHDGWSCKNPVDRIDLRDYVRDRTGFVIDIDYEFRSNNNRTNNNIV